jgi:hypothetical protein
MSGINTPVGVPVKPIKFKLPKSPKANAAAVRKQQALVGKFNATGGKLAPKVKLNIQKAALARRQVK